MTELGIDVKTRFVYVPPRYPKKQMKGLGKKTDLVVWANEFHNPRGP